MGQRLSRSYRDEWCEWGIATALQTLLMHQKQIYTVTDIMDVARMYQVDEQLLHRLSYVPDDLEYENLE
jgi:hypothetical protein